MKKRNVYIGLGLGTALIAACGTVKALFDKNHATDDINDDEIAKINIEDADRGISPITEDDETEISNDTDDGVSPLKADAINSAYKPVKY